ncbi:MAG TPA: HTTM domain-containing protein [Polyangiaceae bacterium]|nr:HTTM domain-containing protein [Polyangiaceae bacterium]
MSDVRWLGLARAAIGALILFRTTPLLAAFDLPFLRSAYPLLGWPDGHWTVAWLPSAAVALLCVVRTVAAVCFAIGYRVRLSGLLCGLSGLVILIDDPFQFVFTVVYLYLAAIVLSLTDASAGFALFPVTARSPESSRWLIRMFLASIYFWAGLYKLRADWLDGRTLDLLRQSGALTGHFIDVALRSELSRRLAAWFVVGLELSLGPALLVRRTRRSALLAAFAFHALLQLAASPDFLGFGMCALLLGCWEPHSRGRFAKVPPGEVCS